MENINFCLACGDKLEVRNIGGEDRKACPSCSFVHWGNYSIGVGACVVKDNKVLLVRRAQEPGKGYWTTPGGYIEQLEHIRGSIAREVWEETGVRAIVTKIIGLRDRPHTVHDIYITFEMEYIDGEPRPDDVEVDGAGFFSLEEMESMNVADLTAWQVDIALNGGEGGLHEDTHPIRESLKKYGLYRTK
ncbi:NUDIX domain-containing protein [Paenibacillus lupini]|uniref:NUDIX domain-containing protein n=1 Tax=Paenibacillus lupini TaxID=1450204 RepID=UPI00141DDEEB|nr:NUDIX domain-containing protein [Paenibacillus lupini]NIK24624.1 ADP-ribose pyrophosphatase YjhB (NUDIX family) [Paenibacillus lupini]